MKPYAYTSSTGWRDFQSRSRQGRMATAGQNHESWRWHNYLLQKRYGNHRNRPCSVRNRGQYATDNNSRKHSSQYQQQWRLQNIIYNIQTRSLWWGNSTAGTFVHFLPERISLRAVGREKNKQDELSGGGYGRFLQWKDQLFQSKNLQKQYLEFPAGCIWQNKNSFQNRQIGGSREKRRTVHQIHSSDT